MKTERYAYEGRPGCEWDIQSSEGALGLEEMAPLIKNAAVIYVKNYHHDWDVTHLADVCLPCTKPWVHPQVCIH